MKAKFEEQAFPLSAFNHILVKTEDRRRVQKTRGAGLLCGFHALAHSINDQICKPAGLDIFTVEQIRSTQTSSQYWGLAKDQKPAQYWDNHQWTLKRTYDLEAGLIALLADFMGRKRGVRVEPVVCRAAHPGAAAHELCCDNTYLAEYPFLPRKRLYIHHDGAPYKTCGGHWCAITAHPLKLPQTTKPLKALMQQPQSLSLRRKQLCETEGLDQEAVVQLYTASGKRNLLDTLNKMLSGTTSSGPRRNQPADQASNGHIHVIVESFNDQIRKPRGLMPLTVEEVQKGIGTDGYVTLIFQKLPRCIENADYGFETLCQQSATGVGIQSPQLEILIELMGKDTGLYCTMTTVCCAAVEITAYSLNVAQSNTMCIVVVEAENLVWIAKAGGGLTGYSSIISCRKKEETSTKEVQG